MHLLNIHKTLNLYDESMTYNACNQIIQRRQTENLSYPCTMGWSCISGGYFAIASEIMTETMVYQ